MQEGRAFTCPMCATPLKETSSTIICADGSEDTRWGVTYRREDIPPLHRARQLRELAEDLEALDDANGCCLHIVVEDYNMSDSDLAWCISNAQHFECVDLALRLRNLVPEERRQAFLGVRVDADGLVHHVPPWRG